MGLYVTESAKEAEALTANALPYQYSKNRHTVKMRILYDYKMVQESDVIPVKQKINTTARKSKAGHFSICLLWTHGKTVLIHNESDDHWKQDLLDSVLEAVLEFAFGFCPKSPRTFPSITFS